MTPRSKLKSPAPKASRRTRGLRRLEQTNDKLEAPKEIERSLSRAGAAPAPAPAPGRAQAQAPASRNRSRVATP